jgi:hypothetical protein
MVKPPDSSGYCFWMVSAAFWASTVFSLLQPAARPVERITRPAQARILSEFIARNIDPNR